MPFAAAGTTDLLGRTVGAGCRRRSACRSLSKTSPARRLIGAAELAKAAPDGYTLGGGTISSHAINVSLYSKPPYDPIKDFTPITMLATLPNMLVASSIRRTTSPS